MYYWNWRPINTSCPEDDFPIKKESPVGGKNVPADQDQPQRQTGNMVLWKNTHCPFVTDVTALFFCILR